VFFLLIGIVLVGTAATLLVRAMSNPRVRTVETLTQIDAYGYRHRAEVDEESSLRRLFDRLASSIGVAIAGRIGGDEAGLRRKLMAAGLFGLSPKRFVGYRLLAAVGSFVFFVGYALSSEYGPIKMVVGVAVATAAGWWVPVLLVNARGKRRLAQIDSELPELIDLLVVTVEAGLGFSGSLRVAASRLHGPLGDELRLVLQEQTMGLATNEALRNMLDRCDTPALRSFVRSVLQGETLGVSIGQILRNLADEMRKRRRATAEEKAQKAPVKILFPLILLIFPAMFVVLLGPVIFKFGDTF
jgi:tight adherence protein C